MIKGSSKTKDPRIDLQGNLITFNWAIFCKKITYYRANRKEVRRYRFVVKFFWQLDKKQVKWEFLQLFKQSQEWNITKLLGH